MHKTERDNTEVVIDYTRLLYRAQFVLGPQFIEGLPSWNRLKVREQLYVTAHPDLNVCFVKNNGRNILLLGFILDPYKPQASDTEILNDLTMNLTSSAEIFMRTIQLGGRWILIVDDGSTVVLFHDAAGLRQVFYTEVESIEQLWCASQPALLAEILGLEIDTDAQDFITSPEILCNREYWWPGDSSLYKEIKRLLPNHYLNLGTGRCYRYWPNQKLSRMSVNTAAETCSSILQGLLVGATHRFDLVISMTAGLDSRLVLAACHSIKEQLSYMTLKQINNSINNSTDIIVASSLLHKLKLPHDIIVSRPIIDKRFFSIFNKNIPFAHNVWCYDALAILNHYNLNKVTVDGVVSESVKFYYKSPTHDRRELNGRYLASLTKMGNHPFAIRHFDKWLRDSEEIYNIDILDMFYWEQRAGNWLATCQTEFDISWKDIFTPYNCRMLLMHMLSTDGIYRSPPHYELHRKMILTLWPEVLTEPINPHKVQTRTQRFKRHLKSHWTTLKRVLSNSAD